MFYGRGGGHSVRLVVIAIKCRINVKRLSVNVVSRAYVQLCFTAFVSIAVNRYR